LISLRQGDDEIGIGVYVMVLGVMGQTIGGAWNIARLEVKAEWSSGSAFRFCFCCSYIASPGDTVRPFRRLSGGIA
jgi:hypothetical protein